MSDVGTEPYVESVEVRTTDGGEHDHDWAIFRCQGGDTYEAFFEDGGWWIQFFPGDPSEGPFESPEAIADRIENDEY